MEQMDIDSWDSEKDVVVIASDKRHHGTGTDTICLASSKGNVHQDMDSFFEQARVARTLSEPGETKRKGKDKMSASSKVPGLDGATSDNGMGAGLLGKFKDKGKRVVGSGVSRPKLDAVPNSGQQKQVRDSPIASDGSWKGLLGSKPDETVGTGPSFYREGCSSSDRNGDRENVMVVTARSSPPAQDALGEQNHADHHRRNSGQRKLVRNGCISPENVAQFRSPAKDKDISKLSYRSPLGDSSKEFVNCVQDSLEPMASHDGSSTSSVYIISGSESKPESLTHHKQQNHVKGKRRCRLAGLCSGASSSSVLEGSAIRYGQSHQTDEEISTPKSTGVANAFLHDSNLALNPEIGKINPAVLDEAEARISQIESDEMLAQSLQEQFNQEMAGSEGTQEVDATIAWTLHEGDAEHARPISRDIYSDVRDRSMAHLYTYGQHCPARISFAQTASLSRSPVSNRSRRSRTFNRHEMDEPRDRLISQLTRGCFRGENVDLDTRLGILESLEEAFDSLDDPFDSSDSVSYFWDSDEDQYEMLLSLDANNNHRCASDNVINSLPVSVIQNDGCEDACSICLECPTAGTVVRHLPCLHKFHKDCIDPWLKMKNSCPVCKSDVT